MRYFIDTEFVENCSKDGVKVIEPISIGIVNGSGREFYAEFDSFKPELCRDWWIQVNVIPNLNGDMSRRSVNAIRRTLTDYIKAEAEVEFWGYYCSYDWVVFCGIWEKMINLPDKWPWYINDLKVWSNMMGMPIPGKDGYARHNALGDARWIRDVFKDMQDSVNVETDYVP